MVYRRLGGLEVWEKDRYFVQRKKPAAAVYGEPGGLERQIEMEVSIMGSSLPIQRGKSLKGD
jgi:hypothetical protein